MPVAKIYGNKICSICMGVSEAQLDRVILAAKCQSHMLPDQSKGRSKRCPYGGWNQEYEQDEQHDLLDAIEGGREHWCHAHPVHAEGECEEMM